MQLILDTHQTIRDLLTHGYDQEQAEGFVRVLQKMNLKNFATKQDIEGVRGEIGGVKNEIERVETKLEYKLREIELRLTVRLGSMIIALGAVLIGIKYFG